jgi:hypothetical protein
MRDQRAMATTCRWLLVALLFGTAGCREASNDQAANRRRATESSAVDPASDPLRNTPNAGANLPDKGEPRVDPERPLASRSTPDADLHVTPQTRVPTSTPPEGVDQSLYFLSTAGGYRFLPDITRLSWTITGQGSNSLNDTDQFQYNVYPGGTPGQLGILWHPIQASSPDKKLAAMKTQYEDIYQAMYRDAQVTLRDVAGPPKPIPNGKNGVRGDYIIRITRSASIMESRIALAVFEERGVLYTIALIHPISNPNVPDELNRIYIERYGLTFDMILESIEIIR